MHLAVQKFIIPGFRDKIFKINRSVTEKFLRQASETTYVEEHSQRFMAKNGREGAMYAEPVEWVSTTGEEFAGNVVINAKIFIGTIWGKLLKRNLLNFKDHLVFSITVFINTKSFEDDLVNFFLKIKASKQVKRSNTLSRRTLQKFLVTTKYFCQRKKFYTTTYMKIFAVEILDEKTVSLCRQQVKAAGVPVVFSL